jgi:ABC-type multidrug transport system ATPase subunit
VSDAPLLACERARIDVAGVPLLEGLSFQTRGRHVGLVGAWSPLFAVLCAEARVASGQILIGGRDATRAVAEGTVGLALFEPGLPSGWKVREYLRRNAELSGITPSAARIAADGILAELGLATLSKRTLGSLSPVERRAVLITHACLGNPPVVALDRPLARIDETSQHWLRQFIETISTRHRLVVSVEADLPPTAEHALLHHLDEVLVLERGCLVAQGPASKFAAAGERYLVTVSRHAAAVVERLSTAGLTVEVVDDAGIARSPSDAAPIADAARLLVRLASAGDTAPLLEASLELEAPLIELVPLAR